jgi:ribosomal protein S18 acetylase RimI-like enzyme
VDYTIREYKPEDAAALRRCVIALQEYERTLEPRLRPGESMADAYCDLIHSRCRQSSGRILVAEHADGVIGFVAVLAREDFTELDDPPGSYALITDLVVLPSYQRSGVGRALLTRAEDFARHSGATELRIGVLAQNSAAKQLYRAAAFVPHSEILSKPL